MDGFSSVSIRTICRFQIEESYQKPTPRLMEKGHRYVLGLTTCASSGSGVAFVAGWPPAEIELPRLQIVFLQFSMKLVCCGSLARKGMTIHAFQGRLE